MIKRIAMKSEDEDAKTRNEEIHRNDSDYYQPIYTVIDKVTDNLTYFI